MANGESGAPGRRDASSTARLCRCPRRAPPIGPPQRIRDKRQQHLPGAIRSLAYRRTPQLRRKEILHSPICLQPTSLRTLSGQSILTARWICEQAHQQLKECNLASITVARTILARSPPCHALMTNARLRLPAAPPPQNGEAAKSSESTASPPQPSFPSVRHAHRRAHHSTAIETMPALSKMDLVSRSRVSKSAKVVLARYPKSPPPAIGHVGSWPFCVVRGAARSCLRLSDKRTQR